MNILAELVREAEERRQAKLEELGIADIVNAIERDPWFRFGEMWARIGLMMAIERR